jgi:hypothetical protein
MTLDSPYYVRVEKPRQALARTMSEMRTWFDAHKIQPSVFKIVPTETGVAVDIQFPDAHHASLFEQKFGNYPFYNSDLLVV